MLVIPIIPADRSIIGELIVPIIFFDGSAVFVISIKILFDGTIIFIVLASFSGVMIFFIFIQISLDGLLPPFNEDETWATYGRTSLLKLILKAMW